LTNQRIFGEFKFIGWQISKRIKISIGFFIIIFMKKDFIFPFEKVFNSIQSLRVSNQLLMKLLTKLKTVKNLRQFTKTFEKFQEIQDFSKYQALSYEYKYVHNNTEIDLKNKETHTLNLFQSVNEAMRIAMETDEKTLVFGEDVAFGGVFRSATGLLDQFGKGLTF
jgi:hypothetical protein